MNNAGKTKNTWKLKKPQNETSMGTFNHCMDKNVKLNYPS